MNNKLFPVLFNMVPQNAVLKHLPWGERSLEQLHFFTETHECSVTDFSALSESELEEMKRSNRFDNDVQWLGNFRFAATNKV